MHWERLLPPLTLSNFDEIWTVASQHYVLQPPENLYQSDYVKMPELGFKVKKVTFWFFEKSTFMWRQCQNMKEMGKPWPQSGCWGSLRFPKKNSALI